MYLDVSGEDHLNAKRLEENVAETQIGIAAPIQWDLHELGPIWDSAEWMGELIDERGTRNSRIRPGLSERLAEKISSNNSRLNLIYRRIKWGAPKAAAALHQFLVLFPLGSRPTFLFREGRRQVGRFGTVLLLPWLCLQHL